MLGAFDAIRGQRSAHSLATGPVTVEPGERERTMLKQNVIVKPTCRTRIIDQPFISPLLFTITPALSVRVQTYEDDYMGLWCLVTTQKIYLQNTELFHPSVDMASVVLQQLQVLLQGSRSHKNCLTHSASSPSLLIPFLPHFLSPSTPLSFFFPVSFSLPFFLSSGFPFLTVARTRSPAPAAGNRFRRPFIYTLDGNDVQLLGSSITLFKYR